MLTVDIRDQEQDIWIWDFAGEVPTRLTFGPGPNCYPVWTPDGLRVAFSSQREGVALNLFWKAADGTGTVEHLTDSPSTQFSHAFSPPDGEQLLFREDVPDTGQDLRVLSLDDARTVTPLVATPFDDGAESGGGAGPRCGRDVHAWQPGGPVRGPGVLHRGRRPHIRRVSRR